MFSKKSKNKLTRMMQCLCQWLLCFDLFDLLTHLLLLLQMLILNLLLLFISFGGLRIVNSLLQVIICLHCVVQVVCGWHTDIPFNLLLNIRSLRKFDFARRFILLLKFVFGVA
jgi:hypothetical protein